MSMYDVIMKWTPILGIESYHKFKNSKNETVWVINCNSKRIARLGPYKAEALSLFHSNLKEIGGIEEEYRIVSGEDAFMRVK